MPDPPTTPFLFSPAIRSVRSFIWRHPEWWSVGLSVVAWLVLTWHAFTAPAMHDHGMGLISWAGVGDVTVMVVAMMVPLALVPLRLTAFRSLWARRHAAMAQYLLGYVGVWTLSVNAALIAQMAMRSWLRAVPMPQGFRLAVVCAVAAAWQLTPIKQRALRACHQPLPLAPAGWRARGDCVRYGIVNAAVCVTTMWPLMVMSWVLSAHVATMGAVTLVCAIERYTRFPTRTARKLALPLAALAGASTVMAVIGLLTS